MALHLEPLTLGDARNGPKLSHTKFERLIKLRVNALFVHFMDKKMNGGKLLYFEKYEVYINIHHVNGAT